MGFNLDAKRFKIYHILYVIHQLTRNLEEWLLRTNKIAFHQSH